MSQLILFFFIISAYAQENCKIQAETKHIRGHSMEELFKPEEPITVETGYYSCHPIKRGDIVIFSHAGRPAPLIKMVMAVPGDHFELREHPYGYHFFINSKKMKTPKGVEYSFPRQNSKMLKLYEQDFKGVMPADTYFVFGTETAGSLDSTRFGPLRKESFLGRVIMKKKSATSKLHR